jgi:hypothetical protein
VKPSKKVLITSSVIITLFIVLLVTLGFYSYYVEDRVSILPLKSLYIRVIEDEVVDFSKIDEHRPEPWFDLWRYSEREKLIEYMKSNDLVIKPGLYEINQTDRFEKVLGILKFEVKKTK